jgi:hypothetical protein
LSVPGRARTIAIMTTTPSTLPSAVPPTVEDDSGLADVPFAETGSLGDLTGRLAEVAHAIRVEADHFKELPDLAVVFADIERALGDLAAAAEFTGYAIIEKDRPPGARATQVSPTPQARAVSWRLHGLASALRASREVCPAVQTAARERARVQQPHRGGAPAGAHVRQSRGPST